MYSDQCYPEWRNQKYLTPKQLHIATPDLFVSSLSLQLGVSPTGNPTSWKGSGNKPYLQPNQNKSARKPIDLTKQKWQIDMKLRERTYRFTIVKPGSGTNRRPSDSKSFKNEGTWLGVFRISNDFTSVQGLFQDHMINSEAAIVSFLQTSEMLTNWNWKYHK